MFTYHIHFKESCVYDNYSMDIYFQANGIINLHEMGEKMKKVGWKVRNARIEKLPVWVTVGDKEVEGNTVSVSSRREGDLGSMTQADLISKLLDDIAKKVR